jgi:hypothetical protein
MVESDMVMNLTSSSPLLGLLLAQQSQSNPSILGNKPRTKQYTQKAMRLPLGENLPGLCRADVEGKKDAMVNPIVILRASGKLGSTVNVCWIIWQ